MTSNLKKIETEKLSEIHEIDLFSPVNGDFFLRYIDNKRRLLNLLITPFACQLIPDVMKYNVFCDLLLLTAIFYIKLSLTDILQAPLRMILGIVDLCLNIVILALSLITRPIASFCYILGGA